MFVGHSCEGVDTVLARGFGLCSCTNIEVNVGRVIDRQSADAARFASVSAVFASVKLTVEGKAEVKSPTA